MSRSAALQRPTRRSTAVALVPAQTVDLLPTLSVVLVVLVGLVLRLITG